MQKAWQRIRIDSVYPDAAHRLRSFISRSITAGNINASPEILFGKRDGSYTVTAAGGVADLWQRLPGGHEAGRDAAGRAPDGVFNVVTGSGAVCGAALTSHPHVAKISFTGSTATGKGIARYFLWRGLAIRDHVCCNISSDVDIHPSR